MNRFAKIVATLVQRTDEATLRELISAGMDVARLNFSHGTHDDHAQKVKPRKLSDELGKPIPPDGFAGTKTAHWEAGKGFHRTQIQSSGGPQLVRKSRKCARRNHFYSIRRARRHEALVPGNHILRG